MSSFVNGQQVGTQKDHFATNNQIRSCLAGPYLNNVDQKSSVASKLLRMPGEDKRVT